MSNLFNEREDVQRLSSEDVVASGVDFGLFSRRYVPGLEGNSKPQSAVSSKTALGDRASKMAVKDTKRSKTALETQLAPQSPQNIPTADFISTTSYKKNAKLIIRVVPTASLGSTKDNKAKLTENIDPRLSFDQFSLQAVAENDDERYQLHETFDDATLFLFGRRPRIWTYQGIVLNGRRPDIPEALIGDDPNVTRARTQFTRRFNMDFANELMRRYDQFYRGTKTVEQRARTYILYDDVIVEGTMLSMVATRNSSVPGAVNCTFTVVVHDRAFIGTDLLNTGEQTLSALLDGEVRDVEVSKLVSPSVIAPRNTFEQLQAEFDVNQTNLITQQKKVERLQRSREEILAEDTRLAQTESQAIDELSAANQAIAQAEKQSQRDAAERARDRALQKLETASAKRQALKDVRASTEDELAEKSAELKVAEDNQELLNEQAQKSSNSPNFTCLDEYKPGQVKINYSVFATGSEGQLIVGNAQYRVVVSVSPEGAEGPQGQSDTDFESSNIDDVVAFINRDAGQNFTKEDLLTFNKFTLDIDRIGCIPVT